MYYSAISINIGVVFFVLLVFGLLKWLQIPTGSFLDWVIAVAIFEWLLVVVTVPWNIHFEAKEVIAEAAQSAEKGIPVDDKQIRYAKRIEKASLFVAIALHILSAIGLYTLAATGISALGYISSAAALLLTILRPTIRAYQYLAMRLAMIREQIKYPREDVVELSSRVNALQGDIQQLQAQMNPEDPRSWITTQRQQWEAIRHQLNTMNADFEELRSLNHAEHERLSRESRQAISQLTTDGQFLDHVREIIRFFKTA